MNVILSTKGDEWGGSAGGISNDVGGSSTQPNAVSVLGPPAATRAAHRLSEAHPFRNLAMLHEVC